MVTVLCLETIVVGCTAVQLVDWAEFRHDQGMVSSRRACTVGGWCPFCYEAQKGRAVHAGHFSGGLRITQKGGRPLPLPRKTDPVTGTSTSSSGALAPGWLSGLPEIWAFLTSTVFPDGSKRQPGKLSFSYGSGVITLSLTDVETNLFVSRSSRDMNEVLLGVEQGLLDSTLDWKASKYPSRVRR